MFTIVIAVLSCPPAGPSLFPAQPLSCCSSAPPNHAFTPSPGHGGPQRAGIAALEREVKYSEGMMDEASVTRQDSPSTLPDDSQLLSCLGCSGIWRSPGGRGRVIRFSLSPVFPADQTLVLFLKIPGVPCGQHAPSCSALLEAGDKPPLPGSATRRPVPLAQRAGTGCCRRPGRFSSRGQPRRPWTATRCPSFFARGIFF